MATHHSHIFSAGVLKKNVFGYAKPENGKKINL